MLTLVSTLNYLDRGLIGLLLQAIKGDLGLSDTQLGFLTGIAFGLFYATLGLPIARWADRGNRVTLTSVALSLWAGTVMLCLFITNFVQLVAARVAAAVGESGCMPPTYSLLGDYFPGPAERTRAMAIYMLASPLASLISFGAGGWLNALYGWRTTFFLMGIPALVVALVVKMTINEPRERGCRQQALGRDLPQLTSVFGILWNQRSSRHLIVALILLFTLGLGLQPWYGAFLVRSHGMNTVELGAWLGSIFGLGGVAGILLGSYVSGRWLSGNEPGQMRLSAVIIATLFPCYVAFLLLPYKHYALAALALSGVVFNFFVGPVFALIQRLVADEIRATTLAVVMLLANLIGMGLGPQLVGVLSDLLMPAWGTDSLRYAMLVMCTLALWAAYHLWRAARTVRVDLLEVARR